MSIPSLSHSAVLFLAIASQAWGQAAQTHPDSRYVDPTVPVSARINLAARVNPASARGLLGDITVRIGTEGGRDETIFGRIGGAALTGTGVIVIDPSTHDLRVFDTTGAFVQRVGRRGAGPGEFRAPQLIYLTPRQELWVPDMQRRMTVFARGSDGYKLSRTLPITAGIRSMCALGEELFANAVDLTEPQAVSVLDKNATTTRSFGKIYASPNAIINYQMTMGLVACDSANRVVVYASNAALGEVRGYSTDGRLRWRTILDGVKRNTIIDTKDGSRVEGGAEGAHELLSLHLVPRLGLIVQYGHRTLDDMKANGPPSKIITLRLDPRTGVGEVFTDAWPRLALIRGDHALAVVDDPFPQVQVRSFRTPRN